MLEKLGLPESRTISVPKPSVLDAMRFLVKNNPNPIFAEFGVGIGATTLEVAKIMNNAGEIHIFDFHESVQELKSDLHWRGFTNVHAHGNTAKYWDSYHWSLAAMLRDGVAEKFDIIYIDGAHTYLHDALIFFMADRVLKIGGLMIFDDWNWKFAVSEYMKNVRHNYMTDEQINSQQIGYFIKTLVNNHIGYETLLDNEVYRKIASTTKR